MESTKEIDVNLMLFAGTLIFFLLATAVVMSIYFYRKRLSLERSALHEMHTKLQMDILNSNIEALETERKRFAEDLHDEIGGKLSALRLNLAQLQRKSPGEADTQGLVDRSKEIIDAMIIMVRRVSHNMSPPALEMFGLDNAVNELCTWVNGSSTLSVIMDYRLQHVVLDQKKQLAVYRIIQELFSNTIKHAQANTIHLSLVPANAGLQLQYHDDGKGLDPQLKDLSAGLGFKNIENRVKVIKGKISYNNGGKGFGCTIDFPAN